MEEQEERDKDFSLLQKLAEEEVRQLQCFYYRVSSSASFKKSSSLQINLKTGFIQILISAFFKADTVKSLEKENMKLIEAIGDMEQITRKDKKKMESMEENMLKEREKVREQINKTVNEVINLTHTKSPKHSPKS